MGLDTLGLLLHFYRVSERTPKSFPHLCKQPALDVAFLSSSVEVLQRPGCARLLLSQELTARGKKKG